MAKAAAQEPLVCGEGIVGVELLGDIGYEEEDCH